ncbi:MAG: heavy metal translocating P-type ATPase [Myxococcales bacterium]|nr:heavy metal translocating P-type ATPase [Myxococcales bacterium]
MLVQLILIGSAAAIGRRLYQEWRRPSTAWVAAPDEAAMVPTASTDAASVDALSEEIQALNTDIALSVGGLASIGAGMAIAPPLGLLAIPCVALPLIPLVRYSWDDSRAKKRLSLAALESISAVAALLGGHVALCAFGMAVFIGGRRLVLATRRRTWSEVNDAFADWSEDVWLLRDGVEVQATLAEVQAGDRVVVRAGQPIPCDGTVVEGHLAVDESMMTGESRLAEKIAGETVFAATLAVAGRAVIVAETAGADSVAARLSALIAATASFEQTVQEESDAIADASVAPALAMGGMGLAVRGLSGGIAGIWANLIDVFWLSSPTAALALARSAARNGILVKDGRSFEHLASIDTMVFDKTGTLTLNTLREVGVHPADGFDEGRLLRLAAAAEQGQRHPIARAITASAEARGIHFADAAITASTYHTGFGLRVEVDGATLLIGSQRMLTGDGVAVPATFNAIAVSAEAAGRSLVCLALDGRFVGGIEFELEPRPEARAVVEALRARGIESMILTGDDEGPTKVLANALGIETWFARTLPEDKAAHITALQAQGRSVCFVGDGVNDALAMRVAHVSVSLAGGSTIAVDSAQIVLRDGSLQRLDDVLDLAGRHEKTRGRLIGAAVVPSIAAFGGVLFGSLGPASMVGFYAGGLTVGMGIALRDAFWRGSSASLPVDEPERPG